MYNFQCFRLVTLCILHDVRGTSEPKLGPSKKFSHEWKVVSKGSRNHTVHARIKPFLIRIWTTKLLFCFLYIWDTPKPAHQPELHIDCAPKSSVSDKDSLRSVLLCAGLYLFVCGWGEQSTPAGVRVLPLPLIKRQNQTADSTVWQQQK